MRVHYFCIDAHICKNTYFGVTYKKIGLKTSFNVRFSDSIRLLDKAIKLKRELLPN